MVICFSISKDRKSWRRKNGWSLPLHPLQVLAWFFIIMFAVLYFGILVPSLPKGAWQISAYVINSVIFLVHIIIHLVSISLDPADINVRAKLTSGPLPAFDRKKHSHVIENQYCYICEVKVGNRSKHCSACNKCVSGFDHHCKWLNNCVGGRNYQLFLSCITSAFFGCVLIFGLSIALIVAYFSSNSWLNTSRDQELKIRGNSHSSFGGILNSSSGIFVATTDVPMQTVTNSSLVNKETGYNYIAFVPVSGLVWLAIVICSAFLSFLGIALLGHLLGFHVFLMCQNFSTYDYIVQKRDHVSHSLSSQNHNQPSSKFIRLPFRLLQQMKTKKANQVTPGRTDGKNNQVEELELQPDPARRPSDDGKTSLPSVVVKSSSVESRRKEVDIENYVGNVYIGSPHRRRNYLEPLHVRSKPNSNNQKPIESVKLETKYEASAAIHAVDSDSEEIKIAPTSPKTAGEEKREEESKYQNEGHVFSHGLARRHLRSPTPGPLLSPIMESEVSTGSAIVSWKHKSVSEQSLHMLTEDDEEEVASVFNTPIKNENESCNASMLSRDNSGSLSNLFMPYQDQTEVIIENNNNCPDTPMHLEEDNRVHEVHIIPNGFKDNYHSADNVIEESNDPFINGELWAYAPRNGCRLPGGVMSFRRSCSMQDECAKSLPKNHLTRCRSEDEIKSNQKMVKLQRRLSDDQNSSAWVVRDGDSKVSKKVREQPPRPGVSATAIFCVEEPDESFSIPNVVFGGKRRYSHFTVPNHTVLPCNNSIHPESHKRTRAVGSKPPKAFHA